MRMVGAVGFELTTPCSQSRCSTRLSYAPNCACADGQGVPPIAPDVKGENWG